MLTATNAVPQRLSGASGFIRNMSVRTKIFLGFGALVAILVIASATSVVSFSITANLFHSYEEVGNLATAAQEVERELAELDQHVEEYAATGDQATHDKVMELEKTVTAEVEEAKGLATTDAEKAEIEAIGASFAHMVAGFEKASVIEEQRAKLANDVLDIAGPKLAADLEAIAAAAAKEGNSNAIILANAALYETMKARLGANLLLARHEKSAAEETEAAFHQLMAALAQLEKVAGAAAFKDQVAEAKALGTQYEEAFKESEKLDEEFNEILEAESLPRRYAGFSPCFRREAGSYGKDTRGIFRVHWFDKVEMFVFTTLEESYAEHEHILAWERAWLDLLELPYRVIDVAAGDLGLSAVRKFDCEAWIPSQGKYREVSSASNCTQFQARRLDIRTRAEDGTVPVATLNGTLCAMTRTIIALLENGQQADGSVRLPAVLHPFLGEVLEPGK